MLGLESMCALTRDAIMLTGDTEVVTSWTALGLDGRRPLRPFKLSVLTTVETAATDVTLGLTSRARCGPLLIRVFVSLPSLTMPTVRHFWNRQNWHRFRLLLSTGQSLFARQTYLEFFWTVRCEINKKESETHLLSRCARMRFCYLEESFAALAGSYSVVLTGGVVATHGAAALGPAGTF